MKEHTIISWPQSGRTWLITMIGKAIYDYSGECDLATKFSPYGFGRDIKNLGSYNLHTFPREHEDQAWLKTCKEISFDKTFLNDMYGKGNKIPAKDVNCIFLVRNPRDTLVSNYNRKTKIKNPNTNFRGTPTEFITYNRGSLQSMIYWLNVWALNFDKLNSYILVRYEDLHYQGEVELRKVLDYIGYKDIPTHIVKNAVAFANIENMRDIEKREGNTNHSMFSKNLNFVGNGKIGNGWNFFNDKDNEYISSYISMLDSIYGYNEDV